MSRRTTEVILTYQASSRSTSDIVTHFAMIVVLNYNHVLEVFICHI